MALPGSSHTIGLWPVIAALVGNFIVTAIKLFAAFTSGSSALFSEAIHSIADTVNQALLLIGIKRSRKKADEDFGYGYGRERFFWALISACGIFFVGAGVTVFHGITSLIEPRHIEINYTAFVVLTVAFFVELWTLYVAARSIQKMYPKDSWRDRIELADPTTLAVLFEDSVAVVGVVIAALAIGLSYLSQSPVWDAVGSLMIGVMLAIVAVALIVKNKSYLIGRAIPEELREEIIKFLVADPMIEKVIDFKSTVLDIGVYRIKCEVEITGSALLKDAYKRSTLQSEFDDVQNNFEDFKRFCVDYANRIPRLIGKRIDEVEAKLTKKFPSVRHIDIEIN